MGERIHSLDTVKGIALLGVFFLHARWMYIGTGTAIEDGVGFLLLTASRLAVPLFFLTSGYLLYMKLEQMDREAGREYAEGFLKKIGKSYLAATAIFLPLKAALSILNSHLTLIPDSFALQTESHALLWNFLYIGKLGAGHIWFLIALFHSILFVYLAYRYGHFLKLLAASAVLHLTGILSRAYMVLELPVPKDDALFFGLFFTAAGFYINREKIWSGKPRNFLFGAVIFTNILHVGERVFLSTQPAHDPFFWANYSFLTSAAAITIFIYLLDHIEFGKESFFNRYGKHTLWIYILHPLTLGALIGIAGFSGQQLGVELGGNMITTLIITVLGYFGTAELVVRYGGSSPVRTVSEKVDRMISRLKEKF